MQFWNVDALAYVRGAAPAQYDLLRRCGEVAGKRWRVYAVGGMVRDSLRGCPNRDLDLLVEQDGATYAECLSEYLGGSLLRHPDFCTATLTLPDGQHLDVVQTRAESYAYPGALPTVRPGTLEDDLRRRDFTANSLAVCLNADRFGTLADAGGGYADLQEGVLRIWHDNSFADDPTRIFRALKYAERCGWTLEPVTERLLQEALAAGALATVSPARLNRELRLMLQESRASRHLSNLLDQGVLRAWGWPLSDEAALQELLLRGESVLQTSALGGVAGNICAAELANFWLCLALSQADAEQGRAWLASQSFSREERKAWEQCAQLRAGEADWGDMAAVERASRLASAVVPLLWLYAVSDEAKTREAVEGYLLSWRGMKLWLNGCEVADLLGISGPAIREALRLLWVAQAQGWVDSRDAAKAYLLARQGQGQESAVW